MISTLIVGFESAQLQSLQQRITQYCPSLNLAGIVNSAAEFSSFLVAKTPSLLFINTENPLFDRIPKNAEDSVALEKVYVSTKRSIGLPKSISQSLGYLLSPFSSQDLVSVVEYARNRIQKRLEANQNQQLVKKLLDLHKANELIGIPTLDGYKFIHTQSIIRCEGLQKCTHVISTDKSDMISSYNIGQFKNLLEPYGFFSPHKSHLINLSYMREYKREGTIIFTDGSYVPVSKRRKSEFLQRITRL